MTAQQSADELKAHWLRANLDYAKRLTTLLTGSRRAEAQQWIADAEARYAAFVAAHSIYVGDEESLPVHELVPSVNPGRYALDRPDGPDVSSGQSIAVKLGGQWIAGRVEHAQGFRGSTGLSPSGLLQSAYYFVADEDGDICGLCVGMSVKIS